MFKNKVHDYIENINIRDESKEKILYNILNAEKQSKKILSKKAILCILAAAALISIGSVIASNKVLINKFLDDYLGVYDEVVSDINVQNNLSASISHGIAVNGLQALSDEKTVYILYEIVTPDNITSECSAQNIVLQTDPFTEGGFSERVLSRQENSITKLIVYDAPQSLNDRVIKVKLSNIEYNNTLIDGDWEFELRIDNYNENKEIDLNMPVILNDTEAAIDRIYLSPLSISVDLRYGVKERWSDGIDCTIHTDNGDIAVAPDKRALSYNNETNQTNFHGVFENVIDVEEIIGVSLNDVYIPIE